MKIGIFGNCQSGVLADCVGAMVSQVEIVLASVYDLSKMDGSERKKAMEQILACDIVFAQPIKLDLDPFSYAAIKEGHARVIEFPRVLHSTFHPDFVVLEASTVKQKTNLFFGVQSIIIAAAYLEGLPQVRVGNLFNKYVYGKLGYFYPATTRSMLTIDATDMGYDLTDFLNGRHGNFMYSFHHPKISIMAEIARQALTKADVRFDADASLPPDKLEKSLVCPVYPEIAEQLGLMASDIVFMANHGKIRYDLKDFIDRSYRSYDAYDGDLVTPNRKPDHKKLADARAFMRAEIR